MDEDKILDFKYIIETLQLIIELIIDLKKIKFKINFLNERSNTVNIPESMISKLININNYIFFDYLQTFEIHKYDIDISLLSSKNIPNITKHMETIDCKYKENKN